MKFKKKLDQALEDPKRAGCLVLDTHGKMLVITTPKGIELPKGHIKPGETPAETAVRETLEETGVKCQISNHTPIFIGDIAFFTATPISGKPTTDNINPKEKITGAYWTELTSQIRPKFSRVVETYLNR